MLAKEPTLEGKEGAALHTQSFWRTQRGVRLAATLLALVLLGCIGGFVFRHFERDAELRRLALNQALYRAMTDSVDFEYCHDPAFQGKLGFCRDHEQLEGYLKGFFGRSGNSIVDEENWTWPGGFFFVMRVASTVAYATQGAPLTPEGRAAAILVGMLAIPLFGYALLLASASMLQGAERAICFCADAMDYIVVSLGLTKVSEWIEGVAGTVHRREQLVLLGMCVLIVLWAGGACAFHWLEGWTWLDSFYFCFITLSTVGFGTDIPTRLTSRVLCTVYIFVALSLSTGIVCELCHRKDAELPLLGGLRRRLSSSWKVPAALLLLCSLGSIIFPMLERGEELARTKHAEALYRHLSDLAYFDGCSEEILRSQSFCRNAKWFREELKSFFGPFTPNAMEDRELWTVSGSALFVLSLASTVGYGAQAPHTHAGELATVIFGCLTIPLFMYCMMQASSIVSGCLERHLLRVLARDAEQKISRENISLLAHISLVLLLWFGGAGVLVCIDVGDRWTFSAALYFCFVTLSTIGFSNVMPHSVSARCFVLVYIFMGLGTCASLVSLAARRFERLVADHDGIEDMPGETGAATC
mmetsp:Transcript_13076/g.24054  ORF Transcript_13076/g.24054 Transcript_13076/m.24054 type:complete len:586 (+) Transcript_13076:104-1861(+)